MKLSRIAAIAALITAAAFGSPGVATSAEVSAAGPAATVAARHGLAAAAVPPFGPKTVVMTTCALPRTSLDRGAPASVVSVSGPFGGVYGFASCRTAVPGAMYFFLSRAGHSTHELAPYRGALEAMASDGTGAVYVCYSVRSAHDTWLYLARRSAQGAYSPPTLVTHTVGAFRPWVTLAAAPGVWWLVWSEATSTAQFPQHVLFERRTMLGSRPRHQITFPGADHSDWAPALAAEGQLARLAWVRTGLDQYTGPGPEITRLLPDGSWTTGYYLTGSGGASDPTRMVISKGRAYLVYPYALFLDNGTGHFSRQPLSQVYLVRPHLAVSDAVATIASLPIWPGSYVRIDELRSGAWSSAQWPTVDSFDEVLSQNGHATLVMHKQTTPMLYLVTER